MIYRIIFAFLVFAWNVSTLHSQTIAEKKAGIAPSGGDLTRDMQAVLIEINKELVEDQTALQGLYQKVLDLHHKNAPESEFKEILDQINQLKSEIQHLESNWREMASQTGNQAGYALWHQPESTLGQLVNDYGAQNFVYIMPPEIANIKVSVDSNIPIPRASWNEMMELILNQNGVGIKQLNPYLRQLYLIKQDKSGIRLITNKRHELDFLPPDTRVCFVLSPEPSDVRRIWAFMDKFVNPNSTVMQMVGRDILVIGAVAEVQDLLKLYDFVSSNRGDKEYKIRTLTKVDAEEMAKILGAIFDQLVETPKTTTSGSQERGIPLPQSPGQHPPARTHVDIQSKERRETPHSDVNGLKVIPLSHIAQAVFLVGTKEEIKKADEIVTQVENQVGEAREKVIWWYRTRHSDPEELAQVLEKIYSLMVSTGTGFEREYPLQQGPGGEQRPMEPMPVPVPIPPPAPTPPIFEYPALIPPSGLYQNQYYQQGGYVVNPSPVVPRDAPPVIPNQNRNNFIVDPKSGSIVMVVEAEILPKLKELIRKLDIPKKMVQIEALIFEKRLDRQDNFGLNLLRLGDAATNTNFAALLWNNLIAPTAALPNPPNNSGIFEYILSRKADHGIPAFDLAYRFLIRQEDIQINANPTVVTLNQTPARIDIVEEISINTGVFLVNTAGAVTPESSFTRAQYGLLIHVTPTIHMNEDDSLGDDTPDYITLDTDITFDTLAPSLNLSQPNVVRRHITNNVRIPDGQTVIIGGLRRKNTDDTKQSVPYLGEIPGFGKLFSLTTMSENTVELFIFLTPKIISDPSEDFCRIRAEEMVRRPGDIPEFMCILVEAQEAEKNRLFAGTMNVLFGRPPDRCVPEPYSSFPLEEYDGRY